MMIVSVSYKVRRGLRFLATMVQAELQQVDSLRRESRVPLFRLYHLVVFVRERPKKGGQGPRHLEIAGRCHAGISVT